MTGSGELAGSLGFAGIDALSPVASCDSFNSSDIQPFLYAGWISSALMGSLGCAPGLRGTVPGRCDSCVTVASWWASASGTTVALAMAGCESLASEEPEYWWYS